jgi:hypothetical protein
MIAASPNHSFSVADSQRHLRPGVPEGGQARRIDIGEKTDIPIGAKASKEQEQCNTLWPIASRETAAPAWWYHSDDRRRWLLSGLRLSFALGFAHLAHSLPGCRLSSLF